MNSINISKNDLFFLKPLLLKKSIISTEGKMYYFFVKDNDAIKTKLLKRFYLDTGEDFNNKINTINALINNKDKIDIPQIVLPEQTVFIDDKIGAYIMRYIDGDNLYSVLNNYNITHEQKINYFRQIGELLESMKNIRNNRLHGDYYLGDIHEQNFVVDRDNKIFAIDIDSCKILDNKPFASKLITNNKMVRGVQSKYEYNGLTFNINENTDLLCYSLMILNYISNYSMNTVTSNNYFNYLNYLEKMGIKSNVLDVFYNIYSDNDNNNPIDILDDIPKKSGKFGYKVFEYLYKK